MFNIFKSESNKTSEIDKAIYELQSLLQKDEVREAILHAQIFGNVGIGQMAYIQKMNDLVHKLSVLTGKSPEEILNDPSNLKPKKEKPISPEDDQWLNTLISWANKNNLPELRVQEHMMIAGGYHHGFPRDKKALFNLHTLNLKDCNLTEIPKEIGKLKNLKKLWLADNNLRYLPDEVCNLSQIEELYVPNNNIEKLPESIGKLANLVEINFSSNNLKRLPFSMVLLDNLRKIDFRNQKNIEKISPPDIGSLICNNELDNDYNFRHKISMSDENNWDDLKYQLRNLPIQDVRIKFNGKETAFLQVIEELYGCDIANAQGKSNFFSIAKC
jgi:Leucine-rich repeat (LRR) protein